MAKPRSGYKRGYSRQLPEGEKIPLSEQTYQRMMVIAHQNRCTIGQWCETKLRQCLAIGMTAPPTPASATSHSAVGMKQREVQIDERLMIDIGKFVEDSSQTARQWLRSILLYCLVVEEVRLRGEKREPDRFG